MEGLQLWIAELCVCAAAVAVAENLLPEGNVKKTVYFLLGIIVVTCFISPIENIDLGDTEIFSKAEPFEENVDWLNRTTEDMFKNNVRILIEECLDRIGVKAKKIYIHTDIDSDSCIFIDKVRITAAPEYAEYADTITEEIYSSLGLDADIVFR